MTKVVFHGVAAWVGAISGPRTCEWWNRDPSQLNWDRSLLYAVDLANTPSAVIAGYIKAADIEVDDHVTEGGRTTIGPLWPGGTMIGACWVSDGYLAKLGARAPALTTGTGHDYEFTTVRYFDGEQADRRFQGFHANLLQTHGDLSLVELWHPGTGATGKPAGAWWLDLKEHADPATPPLVPNQPAPLHLASSAAKILPMIETKLPPFKGGFPL